MECRNRLFFIFLLSLLIFPAAGHSAVTCSTACVTSADVQSETSKCVVIYDNYVYTMPSGDIGPGTNHDHFSCGADVTGIMRGTHINNPATYLVPYKCAPLCTSNPQAAAPAFSPAAGTYTSAQSVAIATATSGATIHYTTDGSAPAESSATYSSPIAVSSTLTIKAGAWKTGMDASGIASATYTISAVPSVLAPAFSPPPLTYSGAQAVTISTATAGAQIHYTLDGTTPTESSALYTWPINISSTTTINAGAWKTGMDASGIISATYTISKSQVCTPVCNGYCGQDNKCGGQCPYYDYNTPGKCGNSLCIPACSGAQCGQSDGCSGYCGTIDKNSCGLCGNPPCCTKEICGDNKDNDCNGQADEGCGKLEIFFGSGRASLSEGLKIFMAPGILTRVAGMVAFFFAGLAILIGVFRFELIKRYSRKEVIMYHTVVGFFVLFFLMLHLVSLLFDKGGWAKTIHMINFFVPYLSTATMRGVAYGVAGMYLLILVILNGVVFIGFSRKFGYPLWLLLHRASFAFYALVLIHSVRIGTDFGNPYIYMFFTLLLAASIGVVIYRKAKVRSLVSVFEGIASQLAALKTPVPVSELGRRRELAGKDVLTSGNIVSVPAQQGESQKWYQIYDNNSSIFATVPEGTKPDYYPKILGTMRATDKLIYLEVKKVWSGANA